MYQYYKYHPNYAPNGLKYIKADNRYSWNLKVLMTFNGKDGYATKEYAVKKAKEFIKEIDTIHNILIYVVNNNNRWYYIVHIVLK